MTLAQRLRQRLEAGHALDMAVEPEDIRTGHNDTLAPAAVLIAVTDSAEPGVILTHRASHLRKHAGQIAFPGGRVDPDDKDVIAAALREAQEEIALDPGAVEIVGVSDRYRTFTGFDIHPVLAVVPQGLVLTPHEAEVADVFEVPFEFLFAPANRARKELEFQGATRHYYEIMWEERRIWGATAAIVANLSKRLEYDDGLSS